MKIKKVNLWDDGNLAYYIFYSLDQSYRIPKVQKRPAMVVCAGGAFMELSDTEQEPVAMYYLSKGYRVFILNYNTQIMKDINGVKHTDDMDNGAYPRPLYDLAKMVSEMRLHSEEWGIDVDQIAISGFSAGGHVCACLATQWQMPFLKEKIGLENEYYKPNAVILGYPFIDFQYEIEQMERDPNRFVKSAGGETKRDFLLRANAAGAGENASEEEYRMASPVNFVTECVPPCFIWHTSEDQVVYIGHTLRFVQQLAEHGVPYEYIVFEKGPHGLAMADELFESMIGREVANKDVAQWPDLSMRFLERHFGKRQ